MLKQRYGGCVIGRSRGIVDEGSAN